MFGRGLEVISTEWADDAIIVALLRQTVESRRKRGGRQMFGFYKRNGAVVENPAMMAVARRILKLRDAGFTYREISEDPKVRHHNGKKMAVSTIQKVVTNREFYEQE
jgi:hypothetical protein